MSHKARPVSWVDFSQKAPFPLFKKFDMYNAGCIKPVSNYDRDAGRLSELGADSLRVDVCAGKSDCLTCRVVKPEESISYDFEELDTLVDKIDRTGTLPYLSWCYIPYPLQKEGNWRKLDDTRRDWKTVFRMIYREYARHYRERGPHIGYHEVYNEPDLSEILSAVGPEENEGFLVREDFRRYYLEMYREGALGLREGDPDAVVGGPAYAVAEYVDGVETDGGRTEGFLDFVARNDLPLDFFSFHDYMDIREDGSASLPARIALIKERLDDPRYGGRFLSTEIHINEFSWLNSANGALDGAESPFNFFSAVPRTWDHLLRIIEEPAVTKIHWAQFMESTYGDDPYGLIRKDGHLKAAYHVFKMYADMPVIRARADSESNRTGIIASSDENKACVAVWNRTEEALSVPLELNHIHPAFTRVRRYQVDREHSSWFDGASGDELELMEEFRRHTAADVRMTLELPPYACVYLVFSRENTRLFFPREEGKDIFWDIVRVRRYYPDRRSESYGELDRVHRHIYLGLEGRPDAAARLDVFARHAPQKLRLYVEADGVAGSPADGFLGVFVEWSAADGISVGQWYRCDGVGANNSDDIEAVCVKPAGEGKWEFDADVPGSISDSWDGSVMVRSELRRAGGKARAEITIR